MNIKTLTAALAFAVIAGSALTATTTASQAGYHNHHHKHHGYNRHYGHKSYYGYSGYYKPHCFRKKVKVWDYYGWHWERVRVCR